MNLVPRLIRFARRTIPQLGSSASSIWSGIVEQYQGKLASALLNSDEAELDRLLSNPGDLMWGIESGNPLDLGGERGREMIADLARRVGILPVFSPEQPSPSDNWKPVDHEKLKADLEGIVGPLRVPSGFVFSGNPPGFPSQQMFRLAEWFTVESFMGRVPRNILEIGGGTGGWAIMARAHGSEGYSAIDLPTPAVMSAFFVGKSLGEDNIHLCGEAGGEGVFGHWFSCGDLQEAAGDYDLIVNCNSLPEMDCGEQDRYIDFIANHLSRDGIFYSCNHESDLSNQWRVLSAVNRHGGFRMAYRAPFIPRPGYVEEIYLKR